MTLQAPTHLRHQISISSGWMRGFIFTVLHRSSGLGTDGHDVPATMLVYHSM